MSNNNNSRIRVNIHEYDGYNPFDELVFNNLDNSLDNSSIQNEIRTALNQVRMLDVMAGFFGSMMDGISEDGISEDGMMEIARSESLNYYKTQEKKPNVKLDINESIASESLKEEKCAICLSFFNVGEKITELECNHVLHTECVAEWVKYKSECPACRGPIKTVILEK